MPEQTPFVELTPSAHGHLKLLQDSALNYAGKQQILAIQAVEAAKAATNFPLFFTRSSQTGGLVLTALTSFKTEQNLFVEKAQCTGTYMPTSVQTYPFFLIPSTKQEGSYTIGIDPDGGDFSSDEGEALFDASGNASAHLSQVSSILNNELKNRVNSVRFEQTLSELGLLREMNLVIHFADDSAQRINGLLNINEDALAALSSEQVHELHKKGYLLQIHAMLMSLYQVNNLIQRHNQQPGADTIKQVKIEISRDANAA